jgi:hypothetical protein
MANLSENLNPKISFKNMCGQLIEIPEVPPDVEEIDEGF